LPLLPFQLKAFSIIVLSAIAAGSTGTLAPSSACARLFLLSLALPVAGVLFIGGNLMETVLGSLMVLYVLFLTAMGNQIRSDLLGNLDLVQEKNEIAVELEKKSHELSTERDEFSRLSLIDPLTELSNRRALEIRLECAIPRAQRSGKQFAVGIIDLDDFKAINDQYGHPTGDAVLKTFAQRMQRFLRETDTIARFGGDEFVVLFENLDSSENLEPMLERLGMAITVPFEAAGGTLSVQISGGLALFPSGQGSNTAGELLRQADQALYQGKLHKRDRKYWWVISGEHPVLLDETRAETGNASHRFFAPTYGSDIATILEPHRENLASIAEIFARDFIVELAVEPRNVFLINSLAASEREQLNRYWANHLHMISDSALLETTHRAAARRLGKIHACCGVASTAMVQGYQTWMIVLKATCQRRGLPFQDLQPIMDRRLAVEIDEELEGYKEIAEQKDLALAHIAEAVWHAGNYSELIEAVVRHLQALDEISCTAIVRPDERGVLQLEAYSGDQILSYLKEVKADSAEPIGVSLSSPNHRGPSALAWGSGEIQHVYNLQTDERVAPWRVSAAQRGIRSQAVVPIRVHNVNIVLLHLYSAFQGGFSSVSQRAFLDHLQQILCLGYRRLYEQYQTPKIFSAIHRRRVRQMLAEGDLVMHVQPVIDLRNGALAGVEMLARLRDRDRYLPPTEFLSVFNRDELLLLFEQGLQQSLEWSRLWHAASPQLGIGLNLPAHGLEDHRYQQAVRDQLASHPLPEGHRLVLEVLETERLQGLSELQITLAAWARLGVYLAQDDLGEAYSSLNRLRNIPFDNVKIDQNLVRDVARHPLRVLGFIANLTRLAQQAGARVVVEGLESPGLIEASAILGADLGQGFAIARPMLPSQMLAWTEQHLPYHLDQIGPRTALGTLASEMKLEEKLISVQAWPEIVHQVASRPAASEVWLDNQQLVNTPMGRTRRAMQATLQRSDSIKDSRYLDLRGRYLELLVARAMLEESTPETNTAAGKS